MIDLHLHSTASDGSFSPSEILTLAKEAGLSAISITDHDTIDGVKDIFSQPFTSSVEVFSGVEISCRAPLGFEQAGSIHMLGYGFSIYDKNLNIILDDAKMARAERNPKIIEKLRQLGFQISMEAVEDHFGPEQTGRPHIAEFMKEQGMVKSFREAFDLYLGKDKPAYVDKYKVSCEKAIHTIHNAGGIAVLAHPGLLKFDSCEIFEQFLEVLISYGLDGIEVYYTDHETDQMTYYKDLAEGKGLLVTGGSDFHGSFNIGVDMGVGKGDLKIPSGLLKPLKKVFEEKVADISILEANLGYKFEDISLLENALCHRSYVNENQSSCLSDNERLEFLGDAVVGLCIGQMLMEKSPLKKEGELSKLRSSLVSEPGLAAIARSIDLGRFIKLGKGEALSRGYDKNSILSDAFEAVIAAIYLDSDFNGTYKLLQELFSKPIKNALSKKKVIDYKSMLQEYAQEHGEYTPRYRVLNETGPDHDKTFEIRVELFDVKATGRGRTKKAAEQDSAEKILALLKQKER